MELWSSLLPLIIGSALVPIQIVITTMLLRSPAGRVTAIAWVVGMTVVRLGQGIVFGLILGVGGTPGETSSGTGTGISLLLLVIAIVFYVTAIKQLAGGPDEDAPPPRWMAMIEAVTPTRAFLLGVGLLLIGAKPWVFTLGAIAAIGDAGLDRAGAIVAFLVFVLLAESIHLLLVGIAYVMPRRADAVLDGVKDLLARHNRTIVIVIGAVFGTWFLVKALSGLGVV